jgi:pimeloyl-ACP methyl ester carboxylesterase
MQRELTVDGHRLVALETNPDNTSEPTILLHGFTHSPAFWRTDPVFAAIGPSYALTLPGHRPGAFPPGMRGEQLTAELLAQVLSGAIRQLIGVTPATLVGFSTGAFAALAIAAYQPGLARRIVSISGFAQGRWTGGLGLHQHLVRLGPPGRALSRALIRPSQASTQSFRQIFDYFVVDRAGFQAYPQLDQLLCDLYGPWRDTDLADMQIYYYAMAGLDISPLLAQIQAPTLALTGDRDPIVPPDQSRLIASQVPRGDLEVISGAGHILVAERTAEYTRILQSWLARTR